MKEPIRVGFPVPLSGVYGVEAHDQMHSAHLAIEEFNARGGWNGRPAELLVRDTKFDINLAREMTEELIVKDKADLMVGSLKSEDQVAISQVCFKYGKIFNGICGSDAILYPENRHPYTFHEGMSFHMIGDSVGRYAFGRLGNRVAVLSVDADFGRHTERSLVNVGNRIGVDFVKRSYFPQNEKNLKPQLEEFLDLKPQVVVLNCLGKDQVTAVRQAVELGLQEKARVVVPFFSIANMIEAGPELYEGIIGSATYYWKLENFYQSSKAFNDLHRKKYQGAVAGSYGIFGYNGVRTVLEALKLADSLDSDQIRRAMLSMRFDFSKGPQFYRSLDHQSVQCVVMLEAKPKSESKHAQDLFDILEVVQFMGPRSFHISREVK